jgi:acetylornithine/N-succinyldiaminopimelate aminotransferase
MNREQIAELEKRVLIPTYERLPILAVAGQGCYITDDTGKSYLDFLGGLAVNSLGYNNPEIMATVRDGSESLKACCTFPTSSIIGTRRLWRKS